MTRVYLGIGTNLGDRDQHMATARSSLDVLPESELVAWSSIYETPPVGPMDQGDFLNAAAGLDTGLSPRDLLDALRMIERHSGRDPLDLRLKWGPRTLDLDILLYGERIVEDDDLLIPHPHMHERWFALQPLAEIAPNAIHPRLGRTIADLLRAVPAPQYNVR